MQRWLTLAALAFMASILPVQGGTSLLEMVPKNIDGCLWLDLSQIMAHPIVAEQLEKQQDQEGLRHFRELFARHDLDLYKAFPSAMIFGSRDGGGAMLLETKVPEAQFRTMFEEENPLNVVEQLDGRTVYPFTGTEGKGRKGAAMYLRQDVMISAESTDALRAYQESLKAGGTFAENPALSSYRRRVSPAATVWAVFINPQPQQPDQPQQPQNQMLSMVKGGSLALHLGRKPDASTVEAATTDGGTAVDEVKALQENDLRLIIRLACKDSQGAAFGALSMNGLLMVGIGQAFASDPELGTEMSKLLQLRPQQQDIVLDAVFTGDMITRLKAAMEKLGKGQQAGLSAGGDSPPAPGDNDLLPLPPPPAE
jgi:hypothetical protein